MSKVSTLCTPRFQIREIYIMVITALGMLAILASVRVVWSVTRWVAVLVMIVGVVTVTSVCATTYYWSVIIFEYSVRGVYIVRRGRFRCGSRRRLPWYRHKGSRVLQRLQRGQR